MKNLLLILFASTLFVFCKNEQPKTDEPEAKKAQPAVQQRPPGEHTEIGNFEYWHYIKNEGPKPLPSQVVFYNYQMRQGGRIVQTNFGGTPSGGIIPSEEDAKNDPQALVEGLRHMAVGDSMTIVFPVSDNPDSNYVYDIVLRAIHSR
ncbi:MAG: hypothetical protein H6577_11665 [Lewinellaceae bacterium]|nr:hypothetical protein [Saprospiraceae bacterium]MCB9338774.1 hypothetical protein [Lewinellaceae bacterium]